MEPNQMQVNNPQSGDQTAASLGFATSLLDQLLPKAPQENNPAPETPENQTSPEDLKAEMEGLETRLMDELHTLKAEIKQAQPKDANKEINDLKKQIEQVLNSDE